MIVISKFTKSQMHYVHVNTKYSDISEAVQNKDGLAVFGTLFQVKNMHACVL